MINIYLTAKKIHRLLVLVMIFLTTLMASTGTLLKYNASVAEHFPAFDLNQFRYIHNNLSVIFTIALVLMTISGTLMYFIPYLMTRKNSKPTLVNSQQPTPPNTSINQTNEQN